MAEAEALQARLKAETLEERVAALTQNRAVLEMEMRGVWRYRRAV